MTKHSDAGGAVRRARVAHGMSMRALAAELGVSPATMSAVENGHTPLSVPRLQQIAQLLAVTPGQLLREDLPAPVAHRARGREGPGREGSGRERDWRSFDDLHLGPVLEVAARLFVRQGFHATSIREVAAGVGMSVAGIYHHHPSKERILAALMDATMSEIGWRMDAACAEGSTPAERFALMVEALALFHAVRGDLAFLGASEMRGLTGKNLERTIRRRTQVQHALEEQAELAIADGAFDTPDPRTVCRAVSTMCTSLPSWFRVDGPLSAQQVARSYADYACALMGARR